MGYVGKCPLLVQVCIPKSTGLPHATQHNGPGHKPRWAHAMDQKTMAQTLPTPPKTGPKTKKSFKVGGPWNTLHTPLFFHCAACWLQQNCCVEERGICKKVVDKVKKYPLFNLKEVFFVGGTVW